MSWSNALLNDSESSQVHFELRHHVQYVQLSKINHRLFPLLFHSRPPHTRHQHSDLLLFSLSLLFYFPTLLVQVFFAPFQPNLLSRSVKCSLVRASSKIFQSRLGTLMRTNFSRRSAYSFVHFAPESSVLR